MEQAAAQHDTGAGLDVGHDPVSEDGEPIAPDLLTIGLLVFFVSLVVVVAAMLLAPAVL